MKTWQEYYEARLHANRDAPALTNPGEGDYELEDDSVSSDMKQPFKTKHIDQMFQHMATFERDRIRNLKQGERYKLYSPQISVRRVK